MFSYMLYVLLIRQILLILLYLFGYAIAPDLKEYMEQLSQLGSFMFLNCVIYGLYHLVLMRYSDRYPLLSYNNRSYVLKNLTKSTFLGFMSFVTLGDMINIAITGRWDNKLLTSLGNIYVSTDLTGLLTVPGLSTSTQLHHSVVAILGIINIIRDYETPGIHRAMVVMAYLSVLPYLVNTMLGLRHLKIKSHWVNYILPWFCIIVYSACVFCNVLFQSFYVIYVSEQSLYNIIFSPELNLNGLDKLGYVALNLAFLVAYYVILMDDYQLIRYLHFKASQAKSLEHQWKYRQIMDKVLDEMQLKSQPDAQIA